MISKHDKAFILTVKEISYVDLNIVAPMVIFTIPHVPSDLKPILMSMAFLSKLIDLLKKNIKMGILKSSIAPHSNQWFTMPKNSRVLRFIQDMKPTNKVTIRIRDLN